MPPNNSSGAKTDNLSPSSLQLSTVSSDDENQKRKRNPNSPEISEHHKKYLLDNTSLLQRNKFYLPKAAENIVIGEEFEGSQQSQSQQSQPQQQKPNKITVPPIYLYEVNNYQAILEDIKNIVEHEFCTQQKNNSFKINLTHQDDYRNLTKFYDDKGLKYFTFRDPEKSLLSVVIRDVPISVGEMEIIEALQDKFPVKKVVRLLNKDKRPLPLCVVDLENSEQALGIYGLERLLHSVVSVEPRRKSRSIPQCTRCQRFGHTKNYCKLTPRCVKCDSSHHYSNCPKLPNEKPTCVNCGEPHAASYKGCKYYKDLKAKIYSNQRNIIRANEQPLTQNIPQNPSQQNTSQAGDRKVNSFQANSYSYAHATARPQPTGRSSQQSANADTSSANNSLVDIIINFITDLIKPHLQKIKQFISNLIPTLLQNACI